MSEASTRTFHADDDARSATATAENFHDRDADVDLEYLSEVVMAVHVTDRGAVGCTYYNARLRKLCFMEDVHAGATDVVNSCKCISGCPC
jgi:DNA mismatch repair protein MSH5